MKSGNMLVIMHGKVLIIQNAYEGGNCYNKNNKQADKKVLN